MPSDFVKARSRASECEMDRRREGDLKMAANAEETPTAPRKTQTAPEMEKEAEADRPRKRSVLSI